MNLIVITRKVDKDDSRAGFMVGWLNALALNVSTLYAVSWQEGSGEGLHPNINLISLRGTRLVKAIKCIRFLIRHLGRVQGVLVFQNPEYTILAAPYALLFGKRVVTWYAHGAVTIRRKIMEIFSHNILTSSEHGFRTPLFPQKVHVIGQGIDVARFTPAIKPRGESKVNVLTVGRIAPTKDIESMIQALSILTRMSSRRWMLSVIGTPATPVDVIYLENLKRLVSERGLTERVQFIGGVPWKELPQHLQNAHIFLNMSGTGSLDKAVLEAMACECFVITSNEAFNGVLDPEWMVPRDNPAELANVILRAWALPKERKHAITKTLRNYVVANHNLADFAARVVQSFN